MKTAIIIAAVVIGLIRPMLLFRELGKHASKSYEAVAHLLVGGLFGAWWISEAPWMIWTFGMLAAVEILCGIIVPLERRFC